MRDLTRILAAWLDAGGRAIGEIVIRRAGAGFELRHRDDVGRDRSRRASIAPKRRGSWPRMTTREISARSRPRRTCATAGSSSLPDLAALRRALDYFYPAMLGVCRAATRAASCRPCRCAPRSAGRPACIA